MKLKVQRAAMLLLLTGGLLWNILCLLNIISLKYSGTAITAIGICSVVMLCLPERKEENSETKKPCASDKIFFGLTIALFAACFVTALICIIKSI